MIIFQLFTRAIKNLCAALTSYCWFIKICNSSRLLPEFYHVQQTMKRKKKKREKKKRSHRWLEVWAASEQVALFWQFNFVGRILGPRGMTAKELEQYTGCKIMVRGKGSMRDKGKVRSPLGERESLCAWTSLRLMGWMKSLTVHSLFNVIWNWQ